MKCENCGSENVVRSDNRDWYSATHGGEIYVECNECGHRVAEYETANGQIVKRIVEQGKNILGAIKKPSDVKYVTRVKIFNIVPLDDPEYIINEWLRRNVDDNVTILDFKYSVSNDNNILAVILYKEKK